MIQPSRSAAAPAPQAPAPAPSPAAAPRQETHHAESRAAASKPEARPAKPVHETKPDTKPAVAETRPSAPAPATVSRDDAARARALLEGREGSAAAPKGDDGARLIVQVGAFADGDKAREVRQSLERAGLKTYTQVVDTKDGKRTRVRVGPFASKAEADKAAARIKGLGLSASVLAL